MTAVYIKLVIADSRKIGSVPEKHIVDVAVGVILKGYEDGMEYITIEDVPAKYRKQVCEKLAEEGFDLDNLN